MEEIEVIKTGIIILRAFSYGSTAYYFTKKFVKFILKRRDKSKKRLINLVV